MFNCPDIESFDPFPDTTSAPELSVCDPIVRDAAETVAPSSTDSTPVPSSATVAALATSNAVPAPTR